MTSVTTLRPVKRPIVYNRLRALMLHSPWYTIGGQARLARDCQVYASSIQRLVHQTEGYPDYSLVDTIAKALSRRLGVPIDMAEVFSLDGRYPTARVCDLTRDCKGCFPPEAYDEEGNLLKDYEVHRPGDWCTYPSSSN